MPKGFIYVCRISKRKKKFRLHFSTSLFSHFKMHRVETWKVDYAGIVYYILDKFTICDAEKVNFCICSNAIWISMQGIFNRPVL